MKKYRLAKPIGRGTFSEVLKAQNIKTGEMVAIKAMRHPVESLDKVNNLREINTLKRLSPHPGVITLKEILYDRPSGRLALVMELMSMNLYELIKHRKRYLDNNLVRIYLFQSLRALAHMHERGLFHRDIKPENILIESTYDVYSGLKLADFGSARAIRSRQPFTEYISTRWYRAPECLLTDGWYSSEMDVWGVGCVFFEISALKPLFAGKDEKDQLRRIHEVLGTPTGDTYEFFRKRRSRHIDFNFPPVKGKGLTSVIPGHVPVEMVDLLRKMLTYDPRHRISAKEALMHPYFADLRKSSVPRDVRAKFPKFAAHIDREQEKEKVATGGGGSGSGSGGGSGAASGGGGEERKKKEEEERRKREEEERRKKEKKKEEEEKERRRKAKEEEEKKRRMEERKKKELARMGGVGRSGGGGGGGGMMSEEVAGVRKEDDRLAQARRGRLYGVKAAGAPTTLHGTGERSTFAAHRSAHASEVDDSGGGLGDASGVETGSAYSKGRHKSSGGMSAVTAASGAYYWKAPDAPETTPQGKGPKLAPSGGSMVGLRARGGGGGGGGVGSRRSGGRGAKHRRVVKGSRGSGTGPYKQQPTYGAPVYGVTSSSKPPGASAASVAVRSGPFRAAHHARRYPRVQRNTSASKPIQPLGVYGGAVGSSSSWRSGGGTRWRG